MTTQLESEQTEPNRVFWQGNIAIAEGAIAAGCRFFAGYPITPASEIAHWMAKRLPEVNGAFIEMEDELASIGAVVGASLAGVKAMTATSGPGMSLMMETLGYAIFTQTPMVLVDVQRAGPSTGQATKVGQGDVLQARFGSHGDYEIITITPSTVEEAYLSMGQAFNLAEEYRTPVLVLIDEHIGHVEETIELPGSMEIINRKKAKPGDKHFYSKDPDGSLVPPMPILGDGFNLSVTGSTHDTLGVRHTTGVKVHADLVWQIINKIADNREKLTQTEETLPEDAQIGIISFGSVSRSVWEAIRLAEQENIRIGHLRLITLWPFARRQVKNFVDRFDKVIVPELNTGLMIREIDRFTSDKTELIPISKVGGGDPIRPDEILEVVVKNI